MTDLGTVDVEMINLKRRLAVGSIGYGTIESFLDDNFEEIEGAETATYATIEWFAGGWSTVKISDYNADVS